MRTDHCSGCHYMSVPRGVWCHLMSGVISCLVPCSFKGSSTGGLPLGGLPTRGQEGSHFWRVSPSRGLCPGGSPSGGVSVQGRKADSLVNSPTGVKMLLSLAVGNEQNHTWIYCGDHTRQLKQCALTDTTRQKGLKSRTERSIKVMCHFWVKDSREDLFATLGISENSSSQNEFTSAWSGHIYIYTAQQ